jgi:formylglycine-generating enzyme
VRSSGAQLGLLTSVLLIASSCAKPPLPSTGSGGAGGLQVSGGGPEVGGGSGGATAGGNSAGGSEAGGGVLVGAGGATLPAPVPKFYPVPGFESCKHAEVKSDCEDGWCRLPASCFVMGAQEAEWERSPDGEQQTAVTLTHRLEIQQKEMTRAEWEQVTSSPAPGPDSCTESACPVAKVSWWDALHAANLLSSQKKLTPCYEPVGCTGTLGVDLVCTGVAEPDKSVYECEGYRLPTRAEAEYAARAGTWSTFYSGDITPYDDITKCSVDPALELIAWYCFNSGDRAHVGGELKPNGFGLYDMIGNLGEWNFEEQHYESSPGGENPRGRFVANPNRLRFAPQYDHKNYLTRTANLLSAPWDAGGSRTGFRFVRTLDPNPGQ